MWDAAGNMVGMPRHLANLGANLRLAADLDLNVHVRYQNRADVLWQTSPLTYRTLGPDSFVDFALTWRPAGNGFDARLYGRNLLDRKNLLAGSQVLWTPEGRAIGIELGWRF